MTTTALSEFIPRQLTPIEIPTEANEVLMWLARFPVERNHPRWTRFVSTTWKSDEVMVAHTYNTVSEVFRRLIKESFLGCPVVDNSDELYGMVDMLSLVSHALNSFDAWNRAQPMPSEEVASWNKFYESSDFGNSLITTVTQLPTWRTKKSYFPVFPGFSLLYVIEQFARLGGHRTPILTSDTGRVTGILTQSMVISLLDQEMYRFGPLRYAPVFRVTAGLSSLLHTVNINNSARNAFQKMVTMGISGLPVVNDEGVLVDTISVRDLRGIGPTAGNFDLIFNSVGVFKEKCRQKYPTPRTPRMPIYVTGTDTFRTLISKFRDGDIHRVVVCSINTNGDPIPTHVITQRDVMRFLLYQIGLMPAPQQLPLANITK